MKPAFVLPAGRCPSCGNRAAWRGGECAACGYGTAVPAYRVSLRSIARGGFVPTRIDGVHGELSAHVDRLFDESGRE